MKGLSLSTRVLSDCSWSWRKWILQRTLIIWSSETHSASSKEKLGTRGESSIIFSWEYSLLLSCSERLTSSDTLDLGRCRTVQIPTLISNSLVVIRHCLQMCTYEPRRVKIIRLHYWRLKTADERNKAMLFRAKINSSMNYLRCG